MPPLRYDWAYRLKRERPAAAGDRQRRHRRRGRGDARTSRMSMARCSGAPRTTIPTCCIGSMSPGSAATLRTRGELLRALRPYVEAQLARGRAAQAHHPPRARPVPWRARRPRVPPGAQRRRAQARRGLVAGRSGARAPTERQRQARRMITRDTAAFLAVRRATARRTSARPPRAAAFLVAPDGFALAEQSAQRQPLHGRCRRRSMPRARRRQHRDLQRALSSVLPTVCFAGDPDTPDALFPNNVFATAPGRLHRRAHAPSRCASAKPARADIRGFFGDVLGYARNRPVHAAASLRTDRRAGHRPRPRPRLLRPVRALRRSRRAR